MAFLSSFRDVQSICERIKSNVSQLSSIFVISEAANIRNNTMEMDLHNNT